MPALPRWKIQKCVRHGRHFHPQQDRKGDGGTFQQTPRTPENSTIVTAGVLALGTGALETLAGKDPETRQQGEQELAWPGAGEEAPGKGGRRGHWDVGWGTLGRWVGQ